MMKTKGNTMKTKLTVDQIVDMINERITECIHLAEVIRLSGNEKLATMYDGEIVACSTMLFRIGEARENG